MKLPNGEKAVIEIAKLRDYCLSAAHPEGRHKARVFRAVLGIGPADSPMLQERLQAAARDQEAVAGGRWPKLGQHLPAKLTDSVIVMW